MADLVKINARIKKIQTAEKVTKRELGLLSRELLEYVMDTKDIDAVNRTLAVLTYANKNTAVLFFNHFLPFKEDNKRFGKMTKSMVKECQDRVNTFLDTDWTIWEWAAEHVDISDKVPDYKKRIQANIKKALADKENGLTIRQIMNAITEEISLGDALAALTANADMPAEEQKDAG